jgi:5'-methylthioadenosine phosphorylase
MAVAAIPQCGLALISGSAGWGLRVPEDVGIAGVRALERGLSFETPWGVVDNWQVLEIDGALTPEGTPRRVLNVFSHGWPLDLIDHSVVRRVGWVLGRAGVRKVLADSTCGSLNRALLPGDFLVPHDVLDLGQTAFSTLPGRFRFLCRGMQLICPAMAGVLERVAVENWPPPGRVYGYGRRLVVGHTWGPRLETPAEARALALLGADVANQSIAADATLAREIGACFVSATYSVNYVDGVIPGEWGEMDRLHEQCGPAAVAISLRTLARISLDDSCGCRAFRRERPHEFARTGW